MTARRTGFLAQFARFGVVGLANTAIGSGLILVLAWQGIDPFAANLVGYVVGTAFSFVANSTWTFGHAPTGRRLVRFFAVVAGAYLFNLAVLALFLRLGWSGVASQLPAMVCFTMANFLGQRYFTFRQEGRAA